MSYSSRSLRLLSILIALAAFGFLLFLTAARVHRVDAITHLVETEAAVDPLSPTGYAGGLRNLIVPEHNNESCQWIVQTQQMLAPDGDWRIRQIKYDNAPIGRIVLTPSPYRWWLGFVAGVDHLFSGRPIGLAAERAARIADPALHLLLLATMAVFVGWRFGIGSAALLSLAIATLFPFGGTFLPGQPGDGSLALICLSASLLLLLAGICAPSPSATSSSEAKSLPAAHASRWFFAAGLAGAMGLWVDAGRTIPLLGGIGLGGLVAVWLGRRETKSGVTPIELPWRHWALGGATAVLAAYLAEYWPGHLGTLNLQEIHPLHGVAWIGLGELLTRLNRWLKNGFTWRDWRNPAAALAALLAVSALPLCAVLTGARAIFAVDPVATYLTNLAGSPIAQNVLEWAWRDGMSPILVATFLPVLLLPAAMGLLVWSRTDPSARTMLALTVGPAVVIAAVACVRLRSWNEFDAILIALLLAIITASARLFESKRARGVLVVALLLVLAPGAVLLTNKALADRRDPAAITEIETLIERDLAHWLAQQAGPDGAVVLAPPNLTTALIYYGGLSGLGTPFLENKAGFSVAARIAGASTPDEARAVALGRNLGYIVVPSWDNFLEEYARWGAADAQHTLIAFLNRWLPPRWLRPVPYHLPQVAGFEGQSVAIFRVTEVQDNATALSYLAEYFVEMEMIEQAVAVANTLESSYPADLGASVARAIVARAAQDAPASARAFKDVKASLARGDSEYLLWDRRVSLAIALVEGRQLEQALEEMKRCVAEIDEAGLRSLTTVSLHRFLVMCRSFNLKIESPQLESLAQRLLPPVLRKRP